MHGSSTHLAWEDGLVAPTGARQVRLLATTAILTILVAAAALLAFSQTNTAALPVASATVRSLPASATLRSLPASATLRSLPAAAASPVSAALGRDSPAYGVHGLAATNAAQRLSARFGRAGVTITAGSTTFGMSLKGFGRGSALRTIRAATPKATGSEVAYRQGALVQTWRNGPLGLEQGFVVAKRPAGAGAIGFSVAVSAAVQVAGGGVSLPGGLSYAGLRATDARGHSLPASIVSVTGGFVISVNDRGAKYPVTVDPFVQRAQLTGADSVTGDYFGSSVAASGNTIVVGTPVHETSGLESGAAYVFAYKAGTWTQVAELTASDAAANQDFGYSVAVSGNMVAIGAPSSSYAGGSTRCGDPFTLAPGTVYEFTEPSSGWKSMTQTAELSEDNSCPNGVDPGHSDELGYSVAIQSSPATIVAGADMQQANNSTPQGAALVYTMPAGGWASTDSPGAVLGSSDDVNNSAFGASVAISGNTIAVGAPTQSPGGKTESGSAYVYTMPSGGWTGGFAGITYQTAELTSSDKGSADEFGYSVGVSGNTIVVGAPNHSTSATEIQDGALYVYVEPSGGWSSAAQNAELSISDPNGEGSDFLGHSVGISGETIIGGTPSDAGALNSGAAYVFTKPLLKGWPATMTQTQELIANPLEHGSGYGVSVGIGNGTVVVGAPSAEPGGVSTEPQSGAAYAYGCSTPLLSELLCTVRS